MIKFIKTKYSGVNILLSQKLKYFYFFNFVTGFLEDFFEIIGIRSIVIYINIIIKLIERLSKYQEKFFNNCIINMDDHQRAPLLFSFHLKNNLLVRE